MQTQRIEEGGLDWITAVLPWSAVRQHRLMSMLGEFEVMEKEKGNKPQPLRVLGYDGWKCGSITYGVRADGVMLRVSGAMAELIANRNPFLLTYATRLDVQVTMRADDTHQTEMVRVRDEAALERSQRAKQHRFKLEYYSDNDGLSTVYIGSRSNEHFGRIYDKAKQSKEQRYEGCIRYEIEFKGALARAMGWKLLDTPTSIATQAPGIVSAWFEARGVTVPCYIPLISFDLPVPTVRGTDDARQIAWLETQVQPTVERLIGTCGIIPVLMALGLEALCPDGLAQED